MAQINSMPTIKIRLRGCDDEESFLQHVLERFTTGGLRLRTKAEPAIGSKIRVAYVLSTGETVFHALCLVTQVSEPRDGRRTLELRFRKMSRDSKRIYDRIMAARQILTRGTAPDSAQERTARVTQVPPRQAPETQPLPKDELQERHSLPTPLSGVSAIPARPETTSDGGKELADTDDHETSDRSEMATDENEAVDHQEPQHRRRSRRLTTEEVLQLEDDEIMEVEREQERTLTPPKPEPVFGEFDLFGDEDIGLGDNSILSEANGEAASDDDHDDLAEALIVGEEDAVETSEVDDEHRDDIVDIEDDLIVSEAEIAEDAGTEASDIEDDLIVAEAEVAEDAGDEASDIEDDLIVAEAEIAEDTGTEASDIEDDLIVEEAELAEGAADDTGGEPSSGDKSSMDLLDAELEGSFNDSFDDMFEEMSEGLFADTDDFAEDVALNAEISDEESLHRATTEETHAVYVQPGQANSTTGQQPSDAFDIVRDAFEFASSDVKSFQSERRDPSTLRLASASYEAIPDETDDMPDIIGEEAVVGPPPLRDSRPSDAYDIVRDAFELASSPSSEFETVRDPTRLNLASAAYQAITDEEIARHNEREATERSSEDQERKALEALSAHKERKGPRPIVGPAVRKKKKGFFDRLFSSDD